MSKKTKPKSDLQGINRLVVDATIGITDLVEAMHKRVVHPPLLPSTPIQHLITNIAGITFKNIRWSTKLLGGGLDKALGQLSPLLRKVRTTGEKEAIRSALNGIVGDYLEEKDNPLKITMQFRYRSKEILLDSDCLGATYPAINGKIILMVHGSCMNDIQWTRKEHNHGEVLAKEQDKTAIYLNYNSGKHISSNGQNLNILLEKLIKQWPVPIEQLEIIAHSMGGLVVRSALYYGKQEQKKWTKHLKKIVFLGTPHHGSPVERTGNYLDVVLESIPYTKPFARLGKIRSSGVTDLRHGNLVDEDWQDNDRFERQSDQRQHIPLPQHIDCYSVAASIEKSTVNVYPRMIGDTLVDVKSALGQHENPDKDLHFKEKNTWVAYGNTHLDLLSNLNIYAKIKSWLV
jgi:pimeloyl-ACP methyl ester carboxylesterase